MECKYCAYYDFVRTLHLHTNSPPITIGRCAFHDYSFGNMTLSVSGGCEHFEPQEHEYKIGDVLKKDNRVIFISGIFEDYYPRCYRCETTKKGGFSASAKELAGYELMFREEQDDEL